MQTLTVEITNERALKVLRDLEEKRFIRIITSPKKNSPAVPGNPMTAEEIRDWLIEAEKGDTMSLQEAIESWQRDTAHLINPGK